MRYLLLFIFITFSANAQILHRQSVSSSQGKTAVTSQGLHVSQTIGQQSTTGTALASGYVVQQGFQQSMFSAGRTAAVVNPAMTVRVFPNPFVTSIQFEFGTEVKGEVEVQLYDTQGRLVHNTKQTPENNRIVLNALGILGEGNYFAVLTHKNFKYSTQIVKLN